MRIEVAAACAAVVMVATVNGCAGQPDARDQCLAMVEGVLAGMNGDYPRGPRGEVITEVSVVTETPLECRGRLFYSNAQSAVIDFGPDYYRTSQGTAN